MKIETLPSEFVAAQPVLQRLEAAGFEAYFVGGAVRDMLLQKPIHDVDIASAAFPEEVKKQFDKTVDTGIQHGTVMVLDHGLGYEITTFRTESTYTDFRRPDTVTFVRSLSEDLQRRDFTINALAMTYDGEIVDLFDGLADLSAGVIRAVGEAEVRFTEDALRMMRALRFSAQLGFQIAPDTRAALQRLAPNLAKIAVERIRVEFEKLLMGQQAAASLAMAIEDGVVTYLPGQLDQWQFDAIMTDLEAQQPATIPVVWAHLLTRSTLNESEMTTFMRTWKTSRDLIKMATAVVPVARHIARRDLWTLYQIYDYRDVLMHVLRLIRTDDAVIADVDAMFAALPIHHTRELRVAGGQLIAEQIVQPGPQMGRILKQIERAVVTGQVVNQPAALLAYAKELSQHD
ncbi:CCA tRNA nucleotidyltransferase [Leuconostoc lactis]|uniref:CCA-adding enzyme n=2 Tax=Leuconostoc lactis TaxID=1246 RepID=A0AAP9EDQ2_LEULA|nr:CCA tRNA nucleotidyltransferase [Leuconostoc lactis]MCC2744059.1 CCA tRNA nucleotidyltransferase [Leuconostoc lactis]MCC2754614.1 CCA tRNA nucleotidyltransferase [Leuconostoc lactis]PAV32324.1 CCA tRNA nucleotidyltransferase [Leuconostoc lactis]QEA44778.1 CCA tRNA nucleotidyltransferase [Leuconostoc lactis]